MRRFCGFLLILVSCGSNPTTQPAAELQTTLGLVYLPPIDFPSVEYDSVALFTVNAMHYQDEKLPPVKKAEQKELPVIGFSILDSLGNPAFQYVDRVLLTAAEKNEIRSVFHLPENQGEIEEARCIAFYRDAFVYYNNEKQVAQAQICFQCRQVYFSSDTGNLADRFTTDGDWDKLQAFVSKLKAH